MGLIQEVGFLPLLKSRISASSITCVNSCLKPSADPRFFGPASYHEDDYPFFYNNIKENVAKRVAAYLENDN
jgi:hypothetical protein